MRKLLFSMLIGFLLLNVPAPAYAQTDQICAVVAEVYGERTVAKTLDGALDFLIRAAQRVNQRYPNEKAGLLIKRAGENIVPYQGDLVGASRLAFKDRNLLIKILSDVPGGNGPSCAEDGPIPNGGYYGGWIAVPTATDPGPTNPTNPTNPGPGSSLEQQMTEALVRITRVEETTNVTYAKLVEHEAAEAAERAKAEEFRQNVKSTWDSFGKPLLKYVVPAIAAFFGGQAIAK